MGKLLTDLLGVFRPVTLCVYDQSTVILLRNPAAVALNRTKHVGVCYHFAYHLAIGDVNSLQQLT